MSLRRLVACGALLVALAHARLSLEASNAADALIEVSADAINGFEEVNAFEVAFAMYLARLEGPKTPLAPAEPKTPLALTTSGELQDTMREVRAQVAEKHMKQLAGCAGEADEAGAIVCDLARAVHSVVQQTQVVDAPRKNERPAALAALHRWDTLGPLVAGPSGGNLGARDVRGLALLLGRPGEVVVDGAAAFAFRVMEGVSGGFGVVSASAEKEGARGVGRWSRLQRAAAAATGALAAPATSCQKLLFGTDSYAAASPMELAVCMFVVDAVAGLQSAQTPLPAEDMTSDDSFSPLVAAKKNVVALLDMGLPIDVGPVWGVAGIGAERAVHFSPAGTAEVGRPMAAVLQFISMLDAARRDAERLKSSDLEQARLADQLKRSGGGKFQDARGKFRKKLKFKEVRLKENLTEVHQSSSPGRKRE